MGGRRATGRAREKPAPALASATAGLVPSLPPRALTVSPAAWGEPPPGLHGNCPRQPTSATGPASHSQDVLGKSTFVFVTHEVTCSTSAQGRSPERPRGLSQAAAGRAVRDTQPPQAGSSVPSSGDEQWPRPCTVPGRQMGEGLGPAAGDSRAGNSVAAAASSPGLPAGEARERRPQPRPRIQGSKGGSWALPRAG